MTEGDTPSTVSLFLTAKPTSDVIVTLTDSANGTVSVSGNTFVFGPSNYSTPQSVAITAVDNKQVDGTQVAVLTFATASSDGNFDGLQVPDLTVTVQNNDLVSGSHGCAVAWHYQCRGGAQ